MSLVEVEMLGALPTQDMRQLHDLITSLIVSNREVYKVHEISLVAGTGKQETRVVLRNDLTLVRRNLHKL